MKADLQTRLYKAGWWGTDPKTGKLRGTPYRIRTIIDTNLSTAFAAGRYKSQRDNVDDRPFWQYVAVMDSRTRAMHRAMHGKIYKFDDPIWKTHYPPNGFNCRCRVRALSAEDLERRGLEPANPNDLAGFQPDLGWDHNPGLLWQTAAEDDAGNWTAIAGQDTWKKGYKLPPAKELPAATAPQLLPAAKTREQARTALDTALGLSANAPRRYVKTPVDTVLIDREITAHVVEKEQDARERYADYILPTLTDPNEVWITAYANGEKIEYRKRYIKAFKGNKKNRGGLAVAAVRPDGSLLWNFIPTDPSGLDRNREGELLYPLPKKKRSRAARRGAPPAQQTAP